MRKTVVFWKVALSNGETHSEGAGQFVEVEDGLSPWGCLVDYMTHTGATVTALSLFTKEGQTWNLPSIGKGSPRFRFFDGVKPDVLVFFGVVGSDINPDTGKPEGGADHFKVIEATYWRGSVTEVSRLSIWVDEHDPRNSWSLVRFE